MSSCSRAAWRPAVEELSRTGGATVEGHVLELPPRAAISYRIHATLAEADEGRSSVQLVYNNLETPLDGAPVLTSCGQRRRRRVRSRRLVSKRAGPGEDRASSIRCIGVDPTATLNAFDR